MKIGIDIGWKYVKPLKSAELINDYERLTGYSLPQEFKNLIIESYGPIGLYEIYRGGWNTDKYMSIKKIVPSTGVNVYKIYFEMIKEIEQHILHEKSWRY